MSDEILKQLSTLISNQQDKSTVVELPEDSPFDGEQRQWLNGLLTGINAIAQSAQAASSEGEPGTPLRILYGSQSGNCEVLAKDLKKYAATQGFEGEIAELDSLTPADLAADQHLLILCSTFGEGEPPDNAKQFYTALMADDAPALPESLQFSVCGLGDSSYAHFNKCATDIETRLSALGASACHELASCDVAFEEDYESWKSAVFNTEVFASAAGARSAGEGGANDNGPAYTKNQPFVANLIGCEKLSGGDSAKCVNHIEISLAGGGEDMAYAVGDALGVWPLNCPEAVEELLQAGGFSGKEVVELKSGPASLRALLATKLDINTVNQKALETWGLESAPEGYQVFDVLSELKPSLDAQRFVDGLRPLQPRLYSIASSPKAHPGEVHLTVGEVHYDLLGKARKGTASTWLGDRLPVGSNVAVYVQASAHFHIPDNDEAPLIMIGPGTGIAPFRAFLEERDMRQAAGKNWLFFGDQHEARDYLYKDQISQWQESGLLSELSLAWSRDSDQKVYVQHLIKKQGETFFKWLEEGAYIYVCGDASRMANDVDQAIREVVAEYGNLDEEGVEHYMERLSQNERYQRDVY